MGRLRAAPDVWQSIEDRRQLRQRLNNCDLATDHGRGLHDSIKQQLADLHSQYGATAAEGEQFLDMVDHLASGQWVDTSHPRYRDALIVAGRIKARQNAAQGRIVP